MLIDSLSGGKGKYGSVLMENKAGKCWKIRVRTKEKRGNYLKIIPKNHGADKFRAGSIAYMQKPEKYKRILQEEWEAFAVFADGKANWAGLPDPELRDICRTILNKLIYNQ